ncbi:MAG: DUF4097 family beta strand repeat-containing protein [Clostridiales bacterium]|nr:DUF4097 family beta strand repeat-containing protein [Clostridiales bacterium]
MKKAFFLCSLLGVVLLAACVIAVIDYPYDEGRFVPKSSFRRTIAFERGGTISLENARGNIEIKGWDEERIEISAVERRSTVPARRFYVSTWRQSDLSIRVKESPGIISIETDPTIQKDETRLVNFTLFVPQSVRLQGIRNRRGDIRVADVYGSVDVDLEEGTVRIENFSGSVDVRLRRGDVEAELLDLRPEDDVRIATERGDIRLYLEPQAAIRLEASAPRGRIISDFDLGKEEESAQETRLLLEALNGDIRIKKARE